MTKQKPRTSCCICFGSVPAVVIEPGRLACVGCLADSAGRCPEHSCELDSRGRCGGCSGPFSADDCPIFHD